VVVLVRIPYSMEWWDFGPARASGSNFLARLAKPQQMPALKKRENLPAWAREGPACGLMDGLFRRRPIQREGFGHSVLGNLWWIGKECRVVGDRGPPLTRSSVWLGH
jgi:hypothetical protein